jgi:pilus assembly protein CpaB
MFRILVLVGALAAGGVAAWLSFGLQPDAAPAVTVAGPPPVRTQEILVAAADLEQGASIDEQQLRWQTWPEESVNPAFISRSARPEAIAELTGAVVRHGMVLGEPFREDKLASNNPGYLAAMLSPGMRAVAVRVSVESAAGGFVLPNDRVDVLHTGGHGGGRSRAILTNIKVLAIDQSTGAGEADTALGKTATLELDQAQAEAIASAQTSGALSLALRATADSKESPGLARDSAGVWVRIVRAGQSQVVVTDGPALDPARQTDGDAQ